MVFHTIAGHRAVKSYGHSISVSRVADNSEFSQSLHISEFQHSCAEQLGLFSQGHFVISHRHILLQSSHSHPGIGSGQEGEIHSFEFNGCIVKSEVLLFNQLVEVTYR